jgi:hypothetical protein
MSGRALLNITLPFQFDKNSETVMFLGNLLQFDIKPPLSFAQDVLNNPPCKKKLSTEVLSHFKGLFTNHAVTIEAAVVERVKAYIIAYVISPWYSQLSPSSQW